MIISNLNEILWEKGFFPNYSDDILDKMIKKIDEKYLKPSFPDKNVLCSGILQKKINTNGYTCFEIKEDNNVSNKLTEILDYKLFE